MVLTFLKLMFCREKDIKSYSRKKLLNYNVHLSDSRRRSA